LALLPLCRPQLRPLLLVPARLTRLLGLLLELFPNRIHLLPHGLREVLVELCQDGPDGLRDLLLQCLA